MPRIYQTNRYLRRRNRTHASKLDEYIVKIIANSGFSVIAIGRKGNMYLLKACNKCKGDLVPQEDMYGSYLKCLQCGRITEDAARGIVDYNNAEQPKQKQAA